MTTISSIRTLSFPVRLVVGLFMLAVGLTVVGGVGFASDMAVHNGAHDYRHSMGFPCH
jgi:cobalt transporter subunit CbtB